MLDEIVVSDQQGNIDAKINRKLSLFKIKYVITIDGAEYKLSTKTFWKPSYACVCGSMHYEINEHKELRYSIFRDNVQTGAFYKNKVAIGAGDKYRIVVDNDAPSLLIVCMVIALDNATSDEKDRATITVDFGLLVGERKPFDETWRPK